MVHYGEGVREMLGVLLGDIVGLGVMEEGMFVMTAGRELDVEDVWSLAPPTQAKHPMS